MLIRRWTPQQEKTRWALAADRRRRCCEPVTVDRWRWTTKTEKRLFRSLDSYSRSVFARAEKDAQASTQYCSYVRQQQPSNANLIIKESRAGKLAVGRRPSLFQAGNVGPQRARASSSTFVIAADLEPALRSCGRRDGRRDGAGAYGRATAPEITTTVSFPRC